MTIVAHRRGLTLVEVLAVVALISLVALVSLGSLRQATQRDPLDQGEQLLRRFCAEQRRQAALHGTARQWQISYDGLTRAGTDDAVANGQVALPTGVTIRWLVPDGEHDQAAPAVTFFADGSTVDGRWVVETAAGARRWQVVGLTGQWVAEVW